MTARPPMIFSPQVALAGMPSSAARDSSSTWMRFMGIPEGPTVDAYRSLADYGRAPADEAWVYRCVNLKASFAAGVPLRVFEKHGRELVDVDDTTNRSAQDLQGLLDFVNPVSMNGSDLKAFTTGALSVWGENYIRKVRGRFGGQPQELHWVGADHVEPKVGRTWIDSYEYTARDGSKETYLPRDVIPMRRLNLQDPTRGLSPLASARYEISTNRQAAEWNAATLANWGIPPVYWQIPKDADITPQDQSLIRRALRSLRGPRNQGKAPIIPQGIEAKTIGLTPKDAEWLASRKVSRMTICAVEGVPLVLAGDDDKNTVYANLRDAERIFARYMITELDWVADAFTGWLVPDFDPAPPGQRKLVVAFDYTGIEALQAPLEDRQRVALQEVQTGVRGRREYRRTFAIGKAEDMPESVAEFVELRTLLPIEDVPAGTELDPGTAVDDPLDPGPADSNPFGPPADPAAAADALRAIGRGLYRHPAVRAWIADPSGSLDERALLGTGLTEAVRLELEAGIRRRSSAAQIAASLEGVPA